MNYLARSIRTGAIQRVCNSPSLQLHHLVFETARCRYLESLRAGGRHGFRGARVPERTTASAVSSIARSSNASCISRLNCRASTDSKSKQLLIAASARCATSAAASFSPVRNGPACSHMSFCSSVCSAIGGTPSAVRVAAKSLCNRSSATLASALIPFSSRLLSPLLLRVSPARAPNTNASVIAFPERSIGAVGAADGLAGSVKPFDPRPHVHIDANPAHVVVRHRSRPRPASASNRCR